MVLPRVDAYLSAAPLSGAVAEEVGPFTLFRTTTSWDHYARPRGAVTPVDVEVLRARCDELRLPLAIEWVDELAPTVGPAARAAGLAVTEHPLLVLRDLRPATAPAGVVVRQLGADRAALAAARRVVDRAFGGDGSVPVATVDALEARAAAGISVTVAAYEGGRIVAAGTHQPVGDATELVAVATLPGQGRRGLAAAVTSALVQDALGRGVSLVLLSAADGDVARMYGRVGFTRVGTACAAEPLG